MQGVWGLDGSDSMLIYPIPFYSTGSNSRHRHWDVDVVAWSYQNKTGPASSPDLQKKYDSRIKN